MKIVTMSLMELNVNNLFVRHKTKQSRKKYEAVIAT